MRLWREECATGNFVNTFKHFHRIVNASFRGWGGSKIAVAEQPNSIYGTILFHPQCAEGCSDVQSYEAHTGKSISTLRAHHGAVRSCAYRNIARELYTGGEDGMILVWEQDIGQARLATRSRDQNRDSDAWSDDDDDERL